MMPWFKTLIAYLKENNNGLYNEEGNHVVFRGVSANALEKANKMIG